MKLYKYVPPQRIDILENKLIRFTQADSLNDPFEMRPVVKQLVPDDFVERSFVEGRATKISPQFYEDMATRLVQSLPESTQKKLTTEQRATLTKMLTSILRSKAFREHLPRMLREVTRVAVQVAHALVKAYPEHLPRLVNRSIGALSLSAVPDNSLMWAHYASSHAGLALEFESEHEFFSSGPKHLSLRPVVYSPERPRIEVLSEDKWPWDAWFFSKGSEWSYEQEYRALRLLEDSDKRIANDNGDIHLFSFPPSLLSGVVFGYRTSQETQARIQELNRMQEYKHLKLRQAATSSSSNSIEITDFSQTMLSSPTVTLGK